LPLLIHLARRTEEQPTDFAALRWLRANPRPRKRPRLDERLLMAARLALLALLALWLAHPVLTQATARTPVVAVAPGVDPARAAALVTAGARGVWLAPNFPALDTPPPTEPAPVASLVRDLDTTLPGDTPVTVLVPPVIPSADAVRPQVGREIIWRIVPGRVVRAVKPPSERLAIAVRAAPGVAGLRYLSAAAAVLLPPGALQVAPTSAPLPKTGVVIWWAAGEIPAMVRTWIARGGRLIVPAAAILPPGPVVIVWRDTVGAPLAEAVTVGRGRIVRFTRPLEPAAMPALLEASFPDRLAALIAAPLPPPTRVAARDYAPQQGAIAFHRAETPRDLQPWFAAAIAALFLIERWLATRRRRAPAL
jgi:hypothetical protein